MSLTHTESMPHLVTWFLTNLCETSGSQLPWQSRTTSEVGIERKMLLLSEKKNTFQIFFQNTSNCLYRFPPETLIMWIHCRANGGTENITLRRGAEDSYDFPNHYLGEVPWALWSHGSKLGPQAWLQVPSLAEPSGSFLNTLQLSHQEGSTNVLDDQNNNKSWRESSAVNF